MNSLIILTLISIAILVMGFTGIRLPFLSLKFPGWKKTSRDFITSDENGFPVFEDDPEIAHKVIKKQLKPQVSLKGLTKLFPAQNDEHLFRIRIIKRKVSDSYKISNT